MIYQILFVFALLIVALNNASDSVQILTKEDVDKMNESHKLEIEWSLWPSRTEELQVGSYTVYKREDGKLWQVAKYFVETVDTVTLYDMKDFKWADTYIIYGIAHKDMKWIEKKEGSETTFEITNRDELNGPALKLMRSPEQCFKNHLIILISIPVAIVFVCCVWCICVCCY